MFPLICGCKGKHLVISSLYHTYILFILKSFFYNTMYPFWFAYGCPFFTMLVWLYYWQSRYPFVSMPLQEWMYNNPRYTLGYCCNYYLGKWNTCSKGGFPPFPSPHPTMNGYFYHQIWLLDLNGCCHCWPNSHRYGVTNINNNNICNNDGCSKKDVQSYAEWAPKDHFIFLAIKIYGCFYFRFDSFFTACA
jgi:hypothetical protein